MSTPLLTQSSTQQLEGGVLTNNTLNNLTTDIANLASGAALSSSVSAPLTVALTLAQLQTSHSVPIPLLPAQGAGTLIEVISIIFDLDYGSAAFAGGGAVGAYLGVDATGVLASAAAAATFFTTFTASHSILLAGAMAVAANTAILNTGLVLANPTADFTSGTGASGIIQLTYRVHSGLV